MRKVKVLTPWYFEGEPVTSGDGYYGFVYLVTCHHPLYKGKMYIGYKFFYVNFDKKTKVKDSDWRTYKTSSKELEPLIKELGVDQFSFEILQKFETRGGTVAGEVKLQWDNDVLTARDSDGERLFWNNAIGKVMFIPKETVSEDTKAKISKALVGKPKPWMEGNQNGLGNKSRTGQTTSAATKKKISNAMSKDEVFTLVKGTKEVTGTRQEIRAYLEPLEEWNHSNISQVVLGKRKSHLGWALLKENSNE